MKDYKEANKVIEEAYGTRVPDFDLRPVLELISAVEPKDISSVMTECIIMLTDEILLGNRAANSRSKNMIEILKCIFRSFDEIIYDSRAFCEGIDQQIGNREGYFAKEPDIIYPLD